MTRAELEFENWKNDRSTPIREMDWKGGYLAGFKRRGELDVEAIDALPVNHPSELMGVRKPAIIGAVRKLEESR
jgi:hypothetical protein